MVASRRDPPTTDTVIHMVDVRRNPPSGDSGVCPPGIPTDVDRLNFLDGYAQSVSKQVEELNRKMSRLEGEQRMLGRYVDQLESSIANLAWFVWLVLAWWFFDVVFGVFKLLVG